LRSPPRTKRIVASVCASSPRSSTPPPKGTAVARKNDDRNDPDDDLETDETDVDETDDDDEDADKSEDELRDELKRIRKKLEGAQGSSKRNLRRRRELETELAGRSGDRKPKRQSRDDDDDEVDLDAVREAARAEGRKSGDDRVKRSEAKAALIGEGVSSDRAAYAVGLLKLDDLDLDDDGNVEGIEDAIDDLRDKFPELFTPRRRRRESVAGGGDRNGEAGDTDRRSKTVGQKMAEALLSKGR
jgi:hypothetical protein